MGKCRQNLRRGVGRKEVSRITVMTRKSLYEFGDSE